MSPHVALLLLYSVVLIVIGLSVGRLVKGADAFFVARRGLGAGLIFSTLLAANIGAGSTVGATGIAYREGLSAWWWNGSAGIGSLLLAVWIGPRIWREAKRRNFLTVGDFLEDRYGRPIRGIVAALLWFGTLSILAGQMIGLAWILNVVSGLPKTLGCIFGGVLVTTYFAAGGLASSAWVNMVQLAVKMIGFAVALPMVLSVVGGIAGLRLATDATASFSDFWGPGSAGRLALLVPAFMVSPGLLQKVYGARDERAVRLGVGLNGLALLAFGFVPALLGMTARVLHPSLPNPELALPTLMVNDLPPAVGALALAAVFSAEVSSADAVLFMLSTSLSQDLYRRFLRPDASDQQVLLVARIAAVGGGLLGVAVAIWASSIIGALSVFYSLLGVSLFVPVVAGLHLRRTGTAEALAGIAAGVVLTLALKLSGVTKVGFATPELVGILAAAGCFGLVLLGRALKHPPLRGA